MKHKRRLLWPSSESYLIARERFAERHCSPCAARPSDIILAGSDDENDEESKRQRLRKIVKLGQQYLEGGSLIIPSAQSRGPCRISIDAHEDYDAYDDALAIPTSPNNPLTPPRASCIDNPSSSCISDENSIVEDSIVEETILELLETDANELEHSFLDILAGLEEAKRLSSSVIEAHEEDLAGIAAAKELSQAAAACTPCPNPRRLWNAEEMPNRSTVQRQTAFDTASPFMFRRGKLPKPKLTAKNGRISLARVITEQIDENTGQSRPQAGGAAPLSRFSLGSETPRIVKKRLLQEMQDLGASIEYDGPPVQSSPVRSPLRPKTPNCSAPKLATLSKGDAGFEVPFMSTQAALCEAHKDLLRSSPVDIRASAEKDSSEAGSQSPGPKITPFAHFPQKLDASKRSTPHPQPDTQYIMGDFSPFQFSQFSPATRHEHPPVPAIEKYYGSQLKNLGFKVTKTRDIPEAKHLQSPSKEPELRTQDKRDRSRSRSRSIDQIMRDLSNEGAEVSTFANLLSRENGRPLTPKPQSTPRRGQVLDWDVSSSVSGDSLTPPPSTKKMRVLSQITIPGRDQSSDLPEPKLDFIGQLAFESGSSTIISPFDGTASSVPRSTLKSALRRPPSSSHQDAQREDMDVNHSLEYLTKDVLGSWDVDSALKAL